MKTVFYINGAKITRKKLDEIIGKAAVKELVFLSKERRFAKDALESSFNMGSYGVVTVCFVYGVSRTCQYWSNCQ